MNDELKTNYDKAMDFWNQALIYKKEDFAGVDKDTDYKEIGSALLFEIMSREVKGMKNVLDYGCGTGWLDVIMARNGVEGIKAVDVAANAIDSARLYAEAFDSLGAVDYEAVDTDWLSAQPENTYDGVACCNVLDVIPTEVAESIVKNLARVCRPGSKVLITLNPFFTGDSLKREGSVYEEPYLYINGILRVNNHSDEEWSRLFEKYFKVVKLEHFRWDMEQENRRRFYVLEA